VGAIAEITVPGIVDPGENAIDPDTEADRTAGNVIVQPYIRPVKIPNKQMAVHRDQQVTIT